MEAFSEFFRATAARDGAATLALFLLLLLGRQMVVQRLRATELPLEVRRRWQVTLRNVALAIFIAGTVVIWAEQIRSVAVSIIAFAAAIVLATKELITV